MKTLSPSLPSLKQQQEADKLADFVLFTQRSCILNLSKKLNKDKVSYPQFFLLTYLVADEFLTMSSIAQKMGHSTAAATGLIDKLQELGYVHRGTAQNDRRKIIVSITEKGKKLVSSLRSEISLNLAQLMASEGESESFELLRS